jgi:hypothetical protein
VAPVMMLDCAATATTTGNRNRNWDYHPSDYRILYAWVYAPVRPRYYYRTRSWCLPVWCLHVWPGLLSVCLSVWCLSVRCLSVWCLYLIREMARCRMRRRPTSVRVKQPCPSAASWAGAARLAPHPWNQLSFN